MLSQSFQPEYGRAFKYQFDIQLHSLDMEIPFPCFIQLSWRRKNKSLQTKQKFQVKGYEKNFKFVQKLSMISTCYYDVGAASFKDKNSVLGLVIYINGMPKAGGHVNVNLTSILNATNFKQVLSKTISTGLQKCPIKNSELAFTLEGSYIQEMQSEEHMNLSIGGSDISSLYAKSFTESNFSLNFLKNEPPSKDVSESAKDAASVLRLQDNNKRRSDSVSCYGPTSNSISQPVSLEPKKRGQKSCNVSEYMLPPRKEDKSREEKFKLEAENTQLKIFVQEQGSRLDQQVREISQLRSQLATGAEMIKTLKSQVGKLKQQVTEKQSQASELHMKVCETSSLQKHVAQLQFEVSQTKQLFDKARLENQVLKKDCQGVNKKVLNVQNQKTILRQEIEQLYNKLKDKDSVIENNKVQFQRSHSEKQDLMRNRFELESRLRQLQEEVAHQCMERNKEKCVSLQMGTEYRSMEQALTALAQRVRSLETECRHKETRVSELQGAQSVYRNNIQTLESTRANLCRQFQQVSEELNKRTHNMETLMNTKSKNQHEIGILNQRLHQFQSSDMQLSRMKSSLVRLGDEMKVVRENQSKANDSVRVFKEDNHRLQQVEILKSKQVQALKKELGRLQGQLRDMQTQFRDKTSLNTGETLGHQKTIQQLKNNQQVLQNQKQITQRNHDNLMQTNIQLQIQISMLQSASSQEEVRGCQVDQLTRELVVERSNLQEAEQQVALLQQQIKEKNRHLAIEVQKSKMYNEEATSLQQMLMERTNALDIQKEKCDVLEINIRGLEQRFDDTVREGLGLKQKIQILEFSVNALKKEAKSGREFQARIKELESREAQQLRILQDLNSNLFKSNSVIKQLNRTLQLQSVELANKDRLLREAQLQLVSNEQLKRKSSEISTLTSDNRNLDKKNQLLMKELCVLKQQIQVANCKQAQSQGSPDMLQKIQTMQSQLTKREDKIKKLERENTKLEEENIQLNIKIMKELTELHRKQEGIKVEYSKTLHKVMSESHS